MVVKSIEHIHITAKLTGFFFNNNRNHNLGKDSASWAVPTGEKMEHGSIRRTGGQWLVQGATLFP